MSYYIFALCLIVALSCNVEAEHEKLDSEAIISRTNAAQPVKYLVTIKRDDQTICRGGIIGTWIILTAASCVFNKTTNDFISGSYSIIAGYDNNTIIADVEKIYVPKNPDYETEKIGDIAVLKLKQNLNIKENKKILQRLSSPRKLLGDGYKSYLDEDVKVSTFDEENNITKPFLLEAKVTDESECVTRLSRPVDETELCAKILDGSQGPLKICEHDLGSPLVYNNRVVVGVAIVPSDRCVLNGEPSTYTRVSSFLTFIRAARYGKDENVLVKVL